MAGAKNHTAAGQPVVAPVTAPKLKVKGNRVAYINTIATCFALFFGGATIFAAIAAFTGTNGWRFDMPGLARFWNVSGAGTGTAFTVLAYGLMSIVAGLVALLTVGKITSLDAIKSSWKVSTWIFFILAGLYVLDMVTIAMHAIFGVGSGSGVTQKDIWLSSFLPTVIMAGMCVGYGFCAKLIAAGQTAVLRVMSIMALAIGGAAVTMAIIAQFITMYAHRSSFGSSSRSSSSSSSIWDDDSSSSSSSWRSLLGL